MLACAGHRGTTITHGNATPIQGLLSAAVYDKQSHPATRGQVHTCTGTTSLSQIPRVFGADSLQVWMQVGSSCRVRGRAHMPREITASSRPTRPTSPIWIEHPLQLEHRTSMVSATGCTTRVDTHCVANAVLVWPCTTSGWRRCALLHKSCHRSL